MPTASTVDGTGDQRASTLTERSSARTTRSLAAANSWRARSWRPKAWTARTLRSTSTAVPVSRPASSRAAPSAARISRRCRAVSQASTGSTARPRAARTGSMISRTSEGAAEQQHVGHQRRDGHDDRVEDPPDVGGQPVADLARAHPVVPAQREGQRVREHARPQRAADALGGPLGGRGRGGVQQLLGDGQQHHRPRGGDQQRRGRQLGQPAVERPFRGEAAQGGVDGEGQRPGAQQGAGDLGRGGDGGPGQPTGLRTDVRERQPPQARGGAGSGGRRAHAPTVRARQVQSSIGPTAYDRVRPSVSGCGGAAP